VDWGIKSYMSNDSKYFPLFAHMAYLCEIEVIMAMQIKIVVFLHMTLCRPVDG
jgi:hypothetical protein